MKNSVLIIGLLLSWHLADAKTILVSDIDDTIKNAHILDKSESARNAFDVSNLVLGMGWAYQSLAETDPSIKFFYLSNAPRFLMAKSHQKFLATHAFPSGPLFLRASLFEKEHKIKMLRTLIQLERPNTIILVGDNGERDIPIYNQARIEFPQVQFVTFIRMAYFTQSTEESGVALMDQQTGFATSFELFSKWNQLGLINKDQLRSFVEAFKASLEAEDGTGEGGRPMIFPEWLDCRDVTLEDSLSDSFPPALHRDARITQVMIENRCSVPGSEN